MELETGLETNVPTWKYREAIKIDRAALPWWGTRATMSLVTGKHQASIDESVDPQNVLSMKGLIALLYIFFDAGMATAECRTSMYDLACQMGHKVKCIDTVLRAEIWAEVIGLIEKTQKPNVASVIITSSVDKRPLPNNLFALRAFVNTSFETNNYVKIDNIEYQKILTYADQSKNFSFRELLCFYVYMKSFFGNLKHDDPRKDKSTYLGYGGWRQNQDIEIDLQISSSRTNKLLAAMKDAKLLYEWPDKTKKRATIYTTVNDNIAYDIVAKRLKGHCGILPETHTQKILMLKENE